MNDSSTLKPHWLHSWIPTAVGAVSLLGIVATGGVAWSDMNHKIDSLEKAVASLDRTVKGLRHEPTAKEQQCQKVLETLTSEMSSSLGNRIIELRQLATEMGCVPPPL